MINNQTILRVAQFERDFYSLVQLKVGSTWIMLSNLSNNVMPVPKSSYTYQRLKLKVVMKILKTIVSNFL